MPLARALIVAAVVFALDRAVKLWVIAGLELPVHGYIEVADPWLNLVMAWNRGINFGLLDQGEAGRWVLVGLALAVSLALLAWVRRARGWVAPLGVGAIAGGAVGNAWDRVQYGAVADFINMSCCGIGNPFAFNVADVAIFGGALLLVVFPRPRDRRADARRNT